MTYKDPATQRQFQREWIARRRAAWFADKKCYRCGSVTDLELDHRDPSSKDASLRLHHTNNIWSWSTQRREAELTKCQVLCHSCHQWKTNGCDEHATGERNGKAKLTDTDVAMIRRIWARGNFPTIKALAAELDQPQSTVRDIIRNTTRH